jgi:hypothetical protein
MLYVKPEAWAAATHVSVSENLQCVYCVVAAGFSSFEMVYYITFVYQQTCFFTATADLAFCFRSKQHCVAAMARRRKYLFEDGLEQSLLEELTASDQSSCSEHDDSSGTDDLTVGEVISSEFCDNESDIVWFATASSAPRALNDTFMWEDMTNYVGQREQFVDNCGPQN